MAIIAGTGIIIVGTTVTVCKGAFSIDRSPETFWVGNSVTPQASMRVKSNMHQITFTPDGRITAAQLALLLGPVALVPGADLFSDTELTIIATNGQKWVYKNAAVNKLPSTLKLATSGTYAGSMSFMAIPVSTGLPTDANSLFTYSEGAAFPGFWDTLDEDGVGDDPYVMAHAKTDHYTANWKNAVPADITGFASFYGKEGIDIALSMSAQAMEDDRMGIAGMLIGNVTASASFIPIGPTQAQMDTALRQQGAGAGPGSSITQDGYALAFTGPRLKVTLNNAGLESDSLVFDTKERRQGGAKWVGSSGYAGADYTPAVVIEGVGL